MRQHYPPFYCLENWGLGKLSDLQVSGDVRCKPRFSKSKSSGLSTTEQLPLETRGGCGKQGFPRTLPSLLCRQCLVWGSCEQRWAYCLLMAVCANSKKWSMNSKNSTWRTGKAALCLRLWGSEGWNVMRRLAKVPTYYPQIFPSSFCFQWGQ